MSGKKINDMKCKQCGYTHQYGSPCPPRSEAHCANHCHPMSNCPGCEAAQREAHSLHRLVRAQPPKNTMDAIKVETDGIEIGSKVKFIFKNVNWQGTVMDIRHMMHAEPILCVASEGYPNMIYVPKGQALLVPKAP